LVAGFTRIQNRDSLHRNRDHPFIPLGVCAWLAHAMLDLPMLQAPPGTLRLNWALLGGATWGA